MNIENILKEISEISDRCYQEGGVYYTYTYYHRCAHINSDKDLIEWGKSLKNRNLSDEEVKKIEVFIKCAIGEHHPDKMSDNTPQYLSEFVRLFNEFDRVKLTDYEEDDLSNSIYVEAVSGNNGHKWALHWSID